jgi:hypothetical protein
MKTLGNILIAASALFFIETAFEIYLLTLAHGQQMLFFSLAHIAPSVLLIVALSGIAFICLAVFALVVVILNLVGKLDSLGTYPRFMLIVLCVQIVHSVLLLTYDRWAAALFASGGI